MDKQTLSGYGWIVIVTLVLAVLLALATPFGTYVGDGVTTVVNGFINTNAETLSDDSVESLSNKWEQKFENGINNTVPTVYELQKSYKFEYYSTLEKAVSDVNGGTIGTNADVDKKDAEAGVYTDENGRVNVVLLKNTTLNSYIEFAVGCCFNLGGHTLNFEPTDSQAMIIKISSTELVTIDGSLSNSIIKVVSQKDGNMNGIALFNGARAEVLGIQYIAKENPEKTTNTTKYIRMFYLMTNSELTTSDCVLNSDTTNMGIQAMVNNGGILNMNDTEIKVSTQNVCYGVISYGITNIKNSNMTCGSFDDISYGIYSKNMLNIENSDINAVSSLTADAIREKPYSIGLYNATNNLTTIKNCNIYGNTFSLSFLAGVNVSIEGGTYESYLCPFALSDPNATVYIQDATLAKIEYKDKKYGNYIKEDEYVVHHASFIGDSKAETDQNIKVYMDNVNILGKMYKKEYCLFAIRNNNSLSGNALYMSNCTIEDENFIQINGDLHKLYLGQGNNFKKEDIVKEEQWNCVVETNEIYTKPE